MINADRKLLFGTINFIELAKRKKIEQNKNIYFMNEIKNSAEEKHSWSGIKLKEISRKKAIEEE